MSVEYRRQLDSLIWKWSVRVKLRREHSAVNKIKSAILDHGNPFAVEGDTLHNMITHACVTGEFVEQIHNANDTGQKIYEDYVTVRTHGNISLLGKSRSSFPLVGQCYDAQTMLS